ncbi:MAG TPA: RHS repeat-associated core domain-containing protein, partial [Candidatus Binatia bacterium]
GITSNLMADALGSITAASDTNGQVQTEYTYEPFGSTLITGNSDSNPYEYTARENDSSGLYFYRARYYNPLFQRFISEDAILTAGNPDIPFSVPRLVKTPLKLQPYAYVENAPTDRIDPSGLASCRDCLKDFYRCMADCVIGPSLSIPTFVGMSGPALEQYFTASAWKHAAMRGLKYPNKSSIFRDIMKDARAANAAVILFAFDWCLADCLFQEASCENLWQIMW